MSWTRTVAVASARTTMRASRAMAGQVQRANAQRGQLTATRGVLGPGDPPPPPGSSGLLDYRGLALPRQVRHAANGQVPLGRIIDARRGAQFEIGLAPDAMARHVAVVATTGAGKTESVIVPVIVAALARGEHVFAVDVTGDLFEKIDAYQSRVRPIRANIVTWDFTRPSRSVSWNFLTELDTEESYAAVAEALVGREQQGDPQPYFGQRDRRLLTGLMQAVRYLQPRNPQPELLTACSRDQAILRQVLDAAPPFRSKLAEAATAEAWDYGRVMSGVMNAVEFLDHSGVRAVTTTNELRLQNLLASREPTLVVVAAPLSAGPNGVSTSALMISNVTRLLYRRFGAADPTPVSLVIDEAARLQDRLDYEELLSVSRGARVSVTLGLQNTSQFSDEASRHAILDNCNTFVYIPSPSPGTAEYLQKRLGEHSVGVLAATREFGSWTRHGSRGINRSQQDRPVLGTRELMTPPWGGLPAFVHAPSIAAAPIAVDLTRPDLLA